MTRLGITTKLDTQKQVVNVNPVNNISVSVRSPTDIQSETLNSSDTAETEVKASYNPYNSGITVQPTQENVNKLTADLAQEMNNVEALKIIIKMYKENPIFVNALILPDDEKLATLVKLLTNADEVSVDAEDLGTGCCTAKMYRKVNAIYVITEGTTKTLKYDYPETVKLLKELGINTKLVW